MTSIPEIEEARIRLAAGRCDDLEALAFRCAIFYADIAELLRNSSLTDATEILEVATTYSTVSHAILEYKLLCDCNELGERIPHLAAFAAVHCLTQIIEVTAVICAYFDIRSPLKETEIWKFRNRYSHISTRKNTRSDGDLEGFDLHVFATPFLTPRAIRYKTMGPNGFMIRTANIPRFMRELQNKLATVFESILEAARQQKDGLA